MVPVVSGSVAFCIGSSKRRVNQLTTDDDLHLKEEFSKSGSDPGTSIQLTVHSEDAGKRLDVFLASLFEDCSRSSFKKLVLEGKVRVNQLLVKASYGLREGDTVEYDRTAVEVPGSLVPERMSLDILYEDDEIIVVNKAPGIVVHPGAGCERGTLVHGLLAHCSLASQGAPLRPGLVHRLDKDTSGVMVVAKSDRAYLRLVEQFKNHEIRKVYLALVYGKFDVERGEITTEMGRHPVDRKRMAVLESCGREAVSRWSVERCWFNEISLLRIQILTGRTHQIRVHMSHMNRPVVGDEVYGGGKRRARLLRHPGLRDIASGIDRQMLHAATIEFTHPAIVGRVSYEADLPDDFRSALNGLDALTPE